MSTLTSTRPTRTPYASVWARALRGGVCLVHGLGPSPVLLPLSGWGGPVDDGDRTLLVHCRGATLDVGCGPGRMSEHLALHGIRVLGIDVEPEAVRQTRARGVGAMVRDVFDSLPGEGRWDTVLLADGNIGIGGDPVRLLTRAAELLAPDGRVVVDLPPGPGRAPSTRPFRATLTLECAGVRSQPFPWAFVDPAAVPGLALRTGFDVRLLETGGRRFAVLERSG